jgi:CRISPR-associated protein Csy1
MGVTIRPYNYVVKPVESRMVDDARERLQASERLHRAGDNAGAIAALRAAIAADPALAPAHKALAALLWQSGLVGEARDALAAAVATLPGDGSLWARLAHAELDSGNANGAFAAAARAEAAVPRDAASWTIVGGLHSEFGRYADAERAFTRASQLDPGAPDVEFRLAKALQENGSDARAVEALSRATRRDPGHLNAAVDERLYLPHIYESVADAARWRERYSRGLASLVEELPRWQSRAAQVLDLNHHNFLLAYQGEDDLALQCAYSGFLSRLAGAARPEWLEARPVTFDGARRLRVGFVGAIFRDHTVGRYFERWITALPAGRFERFVYHTSPVSDEFTRRIAAAVDHFAPIRAGNAAVAQRILEDRLDVLVQPDVGMTPMSYLLAALRLAPVQVAGWGHPVTTGSAHVDHYLTCAAMEPAEAPSHYAENLVGLPGLGVDYAMPRTRLPAARAALGLADDARLYACPQSLFKIHPEMDAVFARILAADPQGVLLFFQAPARAVTERFGARLQRALAEAGVPARGQVKFLPRMNAGDFRRLLAAADVVVDTVRWSGGNTSLDALAAGTPIVTLPGRFMRARQTAAMLRLAGLEALIADDVEGLVRLAVDVAGDRERNHALREAIAAGRGALFDRREPIDALAQALLEAGAGARPRSSIEPA